VEIAVEVPVRLKADQHGAKPILKSLAARYFPGEWIYRAKQGFPTDTARWLSGPLSRRTRILLEERTAARGLLDVSALQSADVERDYEAIWTAACLEMFCRQFIDGEGFPDSGAGRPDRLLGELP
jgi:asparagine synthetase B (glutamine-hydrolysing)